MIGRVVSAKMKDTVTVIVERRAMDPLYKKTYVQSKKYLAGSMKGIKEGDVVEIIKVKPISKNKHWKVAKVVGRDLAESVESAQKEAAEAIIAQVMPEEKEKEAETEKPKEQEEPKKKGKKEKK